MEKGNKTFVGILLGIVLLGWWFSSEQSAAVSTQAEPGPPSAVDCQRTGALLASLAADSRGAMANPDVGLLVVNPGGWSITPAADKDALVILLAVQKACVRQINVDYVTVEVRSLADNRVIGSGQRWNFTEE